ncbi:MAG: lamin tail domain-containing protein [Myxococcota bacterium]
MHRSTKLSFLLYVCPLVACGDDVPEVPDESGTTGDTTTTTNTTVTVPTTVTDTDTTEGATDSMADSTGTAGTTEDDGTTDGTTEDDGTTDGTTEDDGTTDGTTDRTTEDSGTTDGTSTTSGTTSGTTSTTSGSSGDTCGDGVADMSEDCDDTDLAGATCGSEGFDGGTLGCNADCTFDTSACTTCGDDVAEGTEICDGADLAGATCASEGFDGGAIDCAPDCTLDTSACTTCGNGIAEGTEECDGADVGINTCADLGMGFTGGTLGCDASCNFDPGACTSVPWPGIGEVVITEIMQNPFTLGDTDGEFFELYNPTMATYQLANCLFEGSTDTGFSIPDDLQIGPLSYLTLATDSMVDQGFVADYQWDGSVFGLNNGNDIVRILCGGLPVDIVEYDDGATFPDPNGASMNLSFDMYDAMLNDIGTNWCESNTSYNGDFGTPGADNIICMAPVTYNIDFCRLQFPNVVDDTEGTSVDAFGRLFIAGLTDISGVNDPAPEVFGSIGYGPDGSDPAVDPGWVWSPTTPNASYGPASPGYEANNDEYTGTFNIPSPPGNYDFAFRFSGDSGATFTYCDGQPEGSSNGYAAADAGQMTSQPGAAPANLYFSEYIEGSSNNKALEIYNADAGDADLTACEVRIYFGANMAAGNTIPLSGTLAAGDTFLICENNLDAGLFDPANCDIADNGSFYNGDDSIELVCSSTTLDVIGQIGTDPGSAYTGGGVSTQNQTLRRDCSVTTGDSNGSDMFDPSVEWNGFMTDDFADFGTYVCP